MFSEGKDALILLRERYIQALSTVFEAEITHSKYLLSKLKGWVNE